MDSKVCVICNTEKSVDNFYNKYRKCTQCKKQRSMKRCYENKDKLSNQRKFYYELENGTRRAQIRRKPLIFPSPNKQTDKQKILAT